MVVVLQAYALISTGVRIICTNQVLLICTRSGFRVQTLNPNWDLQLLTRCLSITGGGGGGDDVTTEQAVCRPTSVGTASCKSFLWKRMWVKNDAWMK